MTEFAFTDHDIVPEAWCPYCRKMFDGAANVHGDDAPQEGDPSICFYCASIGVFTEQGHIVKPTESQMAEFLSDERITFLVSKINEYLDMNPIIDRRPLVHD